MNFEEARDFKQIQSIIKGIDIPSKIEAQPPIMLNTIIIDGDQDKEDTTKVNIAFKVPIYHKENDVITKKGKF